MVKDGVQKRQFEDNLKVMIVFLWIVKEANNYWTIIYFLNEIKKGGYFFSFFVSPFFLIKFPKLTIAFRTIV